MSYINSPLQQERMVTFGQPSSAITNNMAADNNSDSLLRLRDSNQSQASPANQHRESPANQGQALGPTNNADDNLVDSESIHTLSTVKSQQDDVFMPPPPDLTLHLTMPPGSESMGESVVLETNIDDV